MSELTLPPCPACGANTQLIETDFVFPSIRLRCVECRASSPEEHVWDDDYSDILAEIIRIWNRTISRKTNGDMMRCIPNEKMAGFTFCPYEDAGLLREECKIGYDRYSEHAKCRDECYQCRLDWLNRDKSEIWRF